MTFRAYSSYSSAGTLADWDYSKSVMPQQIFPQPSIEIPDTPPNLEKPELQTGFYQEDRYELSGSIRPFLPTNVTKMLEKWAKRPLTDKEALKVMKKIAEIAIDFYNIQEGKYIAIGFDGRIVESADSSLDLLMKIQGRRSSINTFVWHAGSDVFAGWDV